MAVVDAMNADAVTAPTLSGVGDDPGGPEESLDPIIVDMDTQALADELGGRRVEDGVNEEATGPGDARDHLGEVGGAPRRQRTQHRHLRADGGLTTPVAAGHQFIDEAAPVSEGREVAGAAQDQPLVEGGLEVVVVSLDGAIIMRFARVVAAGQHAVVGAEVVVAPGDIGRGIGIEAAERLSVRCSLGTPPRVHNAFWRFSASAGKLSPPSTTAACSQPL